MQLAKRNSKQASKNVALKRYSNVRPSLWVSALVKQAQARKSDFQNNKQLGRDRFQIIKLIYPLSKKSIHSDYCSTKPIPVI